MNTQLAMKSGLLATAAMTALMLMAPIMGMPEIHTFFSGQNFGTTCG